MNLRVMVVQDANVYSSPGTNSQPFTVLTTNSLGQTSRLCKRTAYTMQYMVLFPADCIDYPINATVIRRVVINKNVHFPCAPQHNDVRHSLGRFVLFILHSSLSCIQTVLFASLLTYLARNRRDTSLGRKQLSSHLRLAHVCQHPAKHSNSLEIGVLFR